MAAGGGSVGDANLRSYIDGNFVTLATEQTVEAHKNYAKGISMYGIPWEYDVERDAWTIKGNVIITKGLATYSALKEDDVLSVFDGLPIDNETLQWQETENGKILVAVGGGSGGGLDESKLQDYLDKKKYVTESWIAGKSYYNSETLTKSVIKTKLGISDWALEAAKPGYTFSEITGKPTTIAGYRISDAYTKTEVDENFLGIDDIAVGAVTLKRTATSTSYLVAADNGFNVMNPWNTQTCWFGYGLPTGSAYATTNWRFGSSDGTGVASGNIHCGSVSIGGAKITYNSAKNALVLPFNVIIEGGLATYTKLSGFTNLDVMGGVVTDGTTIHINSAGQLEVIGGTGGGSGSGISLSDVADYLDENGYVTRSSAGALANVSGLTPNTNGMADSGINIGAESLTYRSIYVHNLYPRKAYAFRVYTAQSSTSKYDERLRVGASGKITVALTSDSQAKEVFNVVGNIYTTGTVTESSARKMKDVDYEGEGIGLDVLKKVKVAKWHWKDKRDKKMHIGAIAEDLVEIIPEAVFDTQADDGSTTPSIAYGKAGFSIAASLIAPVARHEDRIKELEENIEKMQKELNKLKKSA